MKAFFVKQIKNMLRLDNLIAVFIIVILTFMLGPKVKINSVYVENEKLFILLFDFFITFFILYGNCYKNFLEERLDKKTDIVLFYKNSSSLISGISLALSLAASITGFLASVLFVAVIHDFYITLNFNLIICAFLSSVYMFFLSFLFSQTEEFLYLIQ